jgi:molecular chaperone GrpE
MAKEKNKDKTGATEAQNKATEETPLSPIEVLTAKNAELTNQLLRLQAEFENFIKREEKLRADSIKFAKKDLLMSLITIDEDFGRALSQSQNSELRQGIEMVHQELAKLLLEEGIAPINATGGPFDPEYHEVLMTVADKNSEDGTVLEEFQRGYMIHDKVLRYSKVKVSKK